MLKPVTTEEKAKFTTEFQVQKATEELLTDLYYSGYDGFADVFVEMKVKKGKLMMTVQVAKVTNSTQKLTKKNAVRYHISQGKGYKKVSK